MKFADIFQSQNKMKGWAVNKSVCIILLIVLCHILSPFVSASEENSHLPNEGITKEQSDLIEIRTNKKNSNKFYIGEEIDFIISVKKPLFLHCFYASGNKIIKLYPDHTRGLHSIILPMGPNSPVTISNLLLIREFDENLKIVAGEPEGRDEIACIASETRMLYKIPESISNVSAFETVNYNSIEEIYEAFERSMDSELLYKSQIIEILEKGK